MTIWYQIPMLFISRYQLRGKKLIFVRRTTSNFTNIQSRVKNIQFLECSGAYRYASNRFLRYWCHRFLDHNSFFASHRIGSIDDHFHLPACNRAWDCVTARYDCDGWWFASHWYEYCNLICLYSLCFFYPCETRTVTKEQEEKDGTRQRRGVARENES